MPSLFSLAMLCDYSSLLFKKQLLSTVVADLLSSWHCWGQDGIDIELANNERTERSISVDRLPKVKETSPVIVEALTGPGFPAWEGPGISRML